MVYAISNYIKPIPFSPIESPKSKHVEIRFSKCQLGAIFIIYYTNTCQDKQPTCHKCKIDLFLV